MGKQPFRSLGEQMCAAACEPQRLNLAGNSTRFFPQAFAWTSPLRLVLGVMVRHDASDRHANHGGFKTATATPSSQVRFLIVVSIVQAPRVSLIVWFVHYNRFSRRPT